MSESYAPSEFARAAIRDGRNETPVTRCPGSDSNRDALRHCPLKTACLPVSPPGRAQQRKGRIAARRGQPRPTVSPITPAGSAPGRVSRRPALDWCPMGLWVAFGFGGLVGAFIGV